MTTLLLYTKAFDRAPIDPLLKARHIIATLIERPDDLQVGNRPTAFLLDPTARQQFDTATLERFFSSGGAIIMLGSPDEDGVPVATQPDLLSAYLPSGASVNQIGIAIAGALREADARLAQRQLTLETAQRTRELDELSKIGIALNTERDHYKLLDLILYQARRLTQSDAGSLYLIEKVDGEARLVFKWAHNHSRPHIPFREFSIPLNNKSIAGYAVGSKKQPVVIDDAYHLQPGVQYTFNPSIDQQNNYRTKSILTVPMINHENDVIGALQLINRKRHFESVLDTPADFENEVVPFTERTVELVSALAGQAAVSIDNNQLLEDREHLFNEFVQAAVKAIELRDPNTFGHSGRVTEMTMNMARAVAEFGTGPYADLAYTDEELREIQYAAQLHDFGKVAVPEQVLVKAKKLYPYDLEIVKLRHNFILRTLQRDFLQRITDYRDEHGDQGLTEFRAQAESEYQAQLADVEKFLKLVIDSNEPTVLPEGNFDELLEYGKRTYIDADGKEQPYLQEHELKYLTIRRGSLNDDERQQIENHVAESYKFLTRIPWTRELANVPEIAYGHHEKLDGSGYPRGVGADQLAPATRMMTIADIFDALTGSDRPYKRALSVEVALKILTDEVEKGMLDADLFKMFVEHKLYLRNEAKDEGSPTN